MWLRVQGHDDVAEQFRRILASNRLATTYLFVGPEGVGKRTFARQLAQTLLCTAHEPADLDPCGQCESCRLFASGGHPDFDHIGLKPGKQVLSLDQFIGAREHRNQQGLCHNIALRPLLSSRRVAIIDDADWFNLESANCLLKTLEEPPPRAVLLLIGTSRSRQLSTILSRAQVIRFTPLDAQTLQQLILAEGLASDADAAAQLAQRAGGSLSRARDRSEAALWEAHDRFIGQWRAGAFDLPRLARDMEELINAAGKEAEPRRERFRQLLGLIGDALSQDLRAADAPSAAVESTLAALDRTLLAEEQIDRNANQATLLEAWIDDLARLLDGPLPSRRGPAARTATHS